MMDLNTSPATWHKPMVRSVIPATNPVLAQRYRERQARLARMASHTDRIDPVIAKITLRPDAPKAVVRAEQFGPLSLAYIACQLGPHPARAIIDIVAHHFGITSADLVGSRRFKKLAFARHMAALIIHERTKMSLPRIAPRLGYRDHTTVLHGIRSSRERLAQYPEFRRVYDSVHAELDAAIAIGRQA